jgi:hypothetical protein
MNQEFGPQSRLPSMLNLLRYRPDGGRERYFECLKLAGPLSLALRRGDSL